eukprot:4117825-Alexandrium_andersonii.AAC.1
MNPNESGATVPVSRSKGPQPLASSVRDAGMEVEPGTNARRDGNTVRRTALAQNAHWEAGARAQKAHHA